MFRAVNEDRQLGIGSLFDNTRLRGAKDGQRLAYEASFVPTVLGSLDGLNEEARRVVFLIAETGCGFQRPQPDKQDDQSERRRDEAGELHVLMRRNSLSNLSSSHRSNAKPP